MPVNWQGVLAGCPVRLRCADVDLLAYARLHLATLEEAGADEATRGVDSEIHWHEAIPPALRPHDLPGLRRVDRDLYCGERELYWFRVDDLRNLHLRFVWDGSHLAVSGDYYHCHGNRPATDRLRRLLWWRLRRLRRRRYTTLLSYLVYYPCLWWLEQILDFHPIHAAGVRTEGGVVLLAGASGVGKSTLAAALGMTPEASLLADSFVVHHGVEIRPVREPLLLDRWAREWLGIDAAAGWQRLDWPYVLGRSGYHPPGDRRAESGRARLLVFPQRTDRPFQRRLPAEEAHARLSAADMIINDLRRYWAFAAVLEQIAPAGLMARREAHLAELTRQIPCWEIGLTGSQSAQEVRRTILNLPEAA